MGSSVHSWVVYCVLVATVTPAAIIDYKCHRIPNWLSFSGWALGPILHLFFAGLPAMSDSLIGLLIALALTFPLFVINWMGAGDVKLMTSVAALAGYDHVFLFLASIFVAGFVVGVIQLAIHGAFMTFARRCWDMLGLSMVANRPVYVEIDVAQRQVVMPYAISIAIGTLVALILLLQ